MQEGLISVNFFKDVVEIDIPCLNINGLIVENLWIKNFDESVLYKHCPNANSANFWAGLFYYIKKQLP